jgi:hypothetical protein
MPDVVATLPPAVGVLICRARLADEMLDALAPAEDGPVAVQLCGLDGVGKTALALHVVHRTPWPPRLVSGR